MPRASGLLPLPISLPALEAELARLERELGSTTAAKARWLLAIERRRVVIERDRLEAEPAA